MSCTNCYNGCTEVVSDQCVKYTGIDVPALGIQNGDSLLTVENAIIAFIEPFLDGSGILPVIDPDIICTLVKQYLPTCTECTGFNLNDVLSAIIKAACDLQEQIDAITEELGILNAPYDVNCLAADPTADTHTVLQFVINKLCQVEIDLAALALDLSTNYVNIADINDYIAAYLAGSASDLISNRMVPYSIVAYSGPINVFDGTGAGTDATGSGLGNWTKIYLCNGNNGTPDLRGRTIVGVTTNVPGPPMNPAVDPAVAGNPNYILGTSSYGANQITLGLGQIPSHMHANTVNTTWYEPPHTHTGTGAGPYFGPQIPGGGEWAGGSNDWKQFPITISSATTGITIATTITNAVNGGSGPHSNIQPSYALNYIIYIP